MRMSLGSLMGRVRLVWFFADGDSDASDVALEQPPALQLTTRLSNRSWVRLVIAFSMD
jgi:hypothetical protein